MERFDWGKHLRADFRHDGFIDASYNIGGAGAVLEPGREFVESTFWEYAQRVALANADTAARFRGKIHFEIPTKTESFAPLPMLTVTENASIGIVMDAGANITEELGAKNVITFGMCLDPASSPISRKSNPIFFDPSGARSFDINLAEFGFEPSVIRSIRIVDVLQNGMAVDSRWIMGNGTEHNPMARDGPYKVINKIGGDYSGRKNAEGLYDQIGKTLGDTMIVASAMPQFEGPVQNPYFGRPDGGTWKQLKTGTAIPAADIPSLIVVKTEDRLNAVRAFFKNVPVIFQTQVGDRATKTFDYYPGQIGQADILAQIPGSYDRMIAAAEKRYTDLITSFANIVDDPENPDTVKLKSAHARFVIADVSRQPKSVLSTDEHRRKAGIEIVNIMEGLGALRDIVVAYFEARQTEIRDKADRFEESMAMYNTDLQALKDLCPQTDAVLRDPRTKVMNPIVVVAQPGGEGFRLPDGRVIPNIEIRLLSEFRAIVSGTPPDRRFRMIIAGLAVRGPVPAAAAAMPVADLEGELRDYANDIIGDEVAEGQQGGARTIVFNNGEAGAMDSVLSSTVPILTAFVDYCSRVLGGGDREMYIRSIYRLLPNIDSPRIVSPSLLEQVADEFQHLADTSILTLSGDAPVAHTLPNSTRDSLIYNAFAMHINSINLKGPDTVGFSVLERMFREAAVELTPASVGAPLSVVTALSPDRRSSEWSPSVVRTLERGRPARPRAQSVDEASMLAIAKRAKRGIVGDSDGSAPSSERGGEGVYTQSQRREGGRRTPRRKNRKSTYRLKKKPSE